MSVAPHIDDRVPSYAMPTDPQRVYVRNMAKKLHLSSRLLDAHCQASFGRPFAQLDRRQCSALIDEMKDWSAIPAELMREAGQMDIFAEGR